MPARVKTDASIRAGFKANHGRQYTATGGPRLVFKTAPNELAETCVCHTDRARR
jgi:hypothetical protein